MENLIEIRGLSKTYATGAAATKALENVSLDVRAGEILVLMGPSGSGKTTLLSIMGCILTATSGSVKVAGREVVGLKEAALPKVRLDHFGFIFQGFNLFPALTVEQNVEIALDLKKTRGQRAHARSHELLEKVGLGGKLKEHPANLSGGQKQRVAIARALAGDPPIILADEPTAALDSTSGRTVMELMTTLAKDKKRAVVIVTHDSRVVDYADRVIRIEDGRIASETNKN